MRSKSELEFGLLTTKSHMLPRFVDCNFLILLLSDGRRSVCHNAQVQSVLRQLLTEVCFIHSLHFMPRLTLPFF